MSDNPPTKQVYRVFVSRPYDNPHEGDKYWKTLLLNAIIPTASRLEEESGYRIEFYDADLHHDVGQVPRKVGRAIDSSDIFLCVLTDYRPSVLYETGYAQKLELPTIYLLDRKLFNDPKPILIGVPDTLYY
ncbi:MAG TPA: hypothetical protein VEZ90_06555, partial [Blastocatellia bacterium]|nr:hypothetical protein [Blastocatellia bacterium]